MHMVSRRENRTIREEKGGEHSLMMSHEGSLCFDMSELSSAARDDRKVHINIVSERHQLLWRDAVDYSLCDRGDTVLEDFLVKPLVLALVL